MSDYGDDYSDYGDDWFYVEEEYIPADDLAEHAVASPPPTTYGDDDNQPDWDRFDYYNDIDYASDGFDDATATTYRVKDAVTVRKRTRARKKLPPAPRPRDQAEPLLSYPPVVWRSQTAPRPEPRLLDDNAQSYALLRDWGEKLVDTPHLPSPGTSPEDEAKAEVAVASEPMSPTAPLDDEQGREEEGVMDIDQEALMTALQSRLAAVGGPLSGMDPQQLLQFAMRMASGQDDGDDIAGEMTDAMLGQGADDEDEDEGEDDTDADAEANLLSWVAQQRNAEASTTTPRPSEAVHDSNQPPAPQPSKANRTIRAPDDIAQSGQTKKKSIDTKSTASSTRPSSSLKRKADDAEVDTSTNPTKKRATRSFDAPTAASQARSLPAKTTRTERAKRS